ncbi:MAG: amidohydrolase family protein [Desulfobacteraceae bacterium]|nr:amidohydrolase family protein [Desulfobacteraceae bacterium]
MVIDFHTHIFPKDIIENRERYFTNESAFKLLYDSPKSKLVSAEDLIRVMDEEKVDKSVIFGFPWVTSDTFKLNNDCIADAVSRYPDRLIGMGCFDLNSPDVEKETQRCLNSGMRGIGELAFYESGIDADALKKMEPVMRLCGEKKFPVLIHTNEPVGHMYPGKTPITLAQIYTLAQTYPDNKIVLAHWGGGIFFFNLLKRDAKDVLKNIYYDTAASPFLYDVAIYKAALDLAGRDKILFGSDYPLLKPSRYFKDVGASGISQADKDRLLGDNAAMILL